MKDFEKGDSFKVIEKLIEKISADTAKVREDLIRSCMPEDYQIENVSIEDTKNSLIYSYNGKEVLEIFLIYPIVGDAEFRMTFNYRRL